jgi:hypothetical protein
MSRAWRAGTRHDPFNIAWSNFARASCRVWAVTSVRSASPYNFIFLFYKKSYIHIYSLYSILKILEYDVLLVRWLQTCSGLI